MGRVRIFVNGKTIYICLKIVTTYLNNLLYPFTHFRPGAGNRVLTIVAEGHLAPLVTTAIFLEYEAVLLRPEHRLATGMSVGQVASFLAAFAAASEPVEVNFRWRPQLPDHARSVLTGVPEMSKSTYPLKLPTSVKNAAAQLAKEDGVSLNRFIAAAVAEKVGSIRTASVFLAERAGDAKPADMLHYLERAPAVEPSPGDEIGDHGVVE